MRDIKSSESSVLIGFGASLMLFVGERFIYFWKPSIKDLLLYELAITPESLELSPTLPNTQQVTFNVTLKAKLGALEPLPWLTQEENKIIF